MRDSRRAKFFERANLHFVTRNIVSPRRKPYRNYETGDIHVSSLTLFKLFL